MSILPKRVQETVDGAADKLLVTAADTKDAVVVTAVLAVAAVVVACIAVIVAVAK
jgi:hypothetical protein